MTSSGDAVVALTWDHPATGGHRDLSLRLGDWSHCCDSYYYAIEAEDIETIGAAAVVRVMQALLRQWKERVMQLADGGVVYLPYDFSDECTAWLRAQRRGEQLDVQAGWSLLHGYTFKPSDFSAVQPTDWKKIEDAPAVSMTLEEWDHAVTHSSAALELLTNAQPLLH